MPTLLLLHGWLASAGLNWVRTFDALAPRYSVYAPDLHGHAGGAFAVATAGPEKDSFEIDRCADDMAALVDRISPDRPVIVVGYSLGGMVAQALWRRHPDRVAGLVLGATSAAPVPYSRGRRPFAAAMSLARHSSVALDSATRGPRQVGRALARVVPHLLPGVVSRGLARAFEASPLSHWAAGDFSGHHWPTVLDAGRAIAEFDARDWIGEIDVPTRILLTARDRLIPPAQQHALAAAIGHSRIETIDSGHFACVRADFPETLLASCRGVEQDLA